MFVMPQHTRAYARAPGLERHLAAHTVQYRMLIALHTYEECALPLALNVCLRAAERLCPAAAFQMSETGMTPTSNLDTRATTLQNPELQVACKR